MRNAFETYCPSSSRLCSLIKFCQPAKIISFGHPNVGLVDGQENEVEGDPYSKSK